jgi:glucose dehydrogenase
MAKVSVGRKLRKFKIPVLVAMLFPVVAYPSWAEDRSQDGGRKGEREEHRQCCEPAGRDFPSVGGNLGNTRFSRLDEINTRNIRRLGGAWHVNLEGGALVGNQQSTPVVVDGVMYVQTAQQHVFAIDAATGAIKWKYDAGGRTFNMRGVAVGGGMVFSTLSDKRVIALNKDTGALVWQTTVANDTFGTGGGGVAVNPGDVNPGALNASGTTPTAITYFDGLIYLGTGGGDGGFRGRFYALKAATGEVAWTFYTTPSPGQVGIETWEGNSWATGGAAPWMHGALDPELGLFYFTAGQPWPVTNGSTRGGDNLFASSLIAVNSKTGEYRWHYQMSHHDLWDYDMVVAPVLFDLQTYPWSEKRKAVAVAGKTGFLYLFDRTNGKPLVGINEEPVPQDVRQKTSKTQPIPTGDAFVPQCTDARAPATSATHPVPNYLAGCIFSAFWDKPTIATPGSGGGADWGYSGAYSSSIRELRPTVT